MGPKSTPKSSLDDSSAPACVFVGDIFLKLYSTFFNFLIFSFTQKQYLEDKRSAYNQKDQLIKIKKENLSYKLNEVRRISNHLKAV